jgi:hypothetical protein
MEIDNLIYNNPEEWVKEFSHKQLTFMYNDPHKCSTCLMYIKNSDSMKSILDYMITYIETENNEWVSEMLAFDKYCKLYNNEDYYIMPTLYNDTKNNILNTKIYENFKGNIYDPLTYGTFLLGLDIFHTDSKIVTGFSPPDHYINCNNYKIEWQIKDGLKKPFILNENTNEWILINNLHVHSKDLKSGLSKDI